MIWYATATAAAVTIAPMIIIQPAIHDVRLRDLLRPLVDRPGERILAGQLGEAQRDRELAEEHQRPGPPNAGPADRKAKTNSWNTPVMIEM